MDTAMKFMSIQNDKLLNNLTSLENYCEKYIPLKMLNMIVECTEDSFKKKDKYLFYLKKLINYFYAFLTPHPAPW